MSADLLRRYQAGARPSSAGHARGGGPSGPLCRWRGPSCQDVETAARERRRARADGQRQRRRPQRPPRASLRRRARRARRAGTGVLRQPEALGRMLRKCAMTTRWGRRGRARSRSASCSTLPRLVSLCRARSACAPRGGWAGRPASGTVVGGERSRRRRRCPRAGRARLTCRVVCSIRTTARRPSRPDSPDCRDERAPKSWRCVCGVHGAEVGWREVWSGGPLATLSSIGSAPSEKRECTWWSSRGFTTRTARRCAAGRRCRRKGRKAPSKYCTIDVLERGAVRSGDWAAEGVGEHEARHVDPRGDGERHAAREAGLTSRSRGRPSASSFTCTLATVVRPMDSATWRPIASRAGSIEVQPATAIPESTLSRLRGTAAATRPSLIGEHVDRVLDAGEVLLDDVAAVPRHADALEVGRTGHQLDTAAAAAVAGLHDRRPRPGLGVERLVEQHRLGHRGPTLAALDEGPLVEAGRSSVTALAQSNVVPAAASSSWRRARGSSSVSTVGNSTSTSASRQTASRCSAKSGSSPRGTSPRRSGGTR